MSPDDPVTPPPQTPEEIWSRVTAHLLRQGRRSVPSMGRGCLYRGPEGTSCAVGCLIPDEAYDPSMEHAAMAEVVPSARGWLPKDPLARRGRSLARALDLSGIPATEENLWTLRELQEIHDLLEPTEWPERLRRGPPGG